MTPGAVVVFWVAGFPIAAVVVTLGALLLHTLARSTVERAEERARRERYRRQAIALGIGRGFLL